MKEGKRHARPAKRSGRKPLPIQALYTVNQLARAMGTPHRRLQKLLEIEGVQVLRVGRLLLVPLAEIEERVPIVWDSLKAAEALRGSTR